MRGDEELDPLRRPKREAKASANSAPDAHFPRKSITLPHRKRVPFGKLALVPIGIDGLLFAGLVENVHLLGGQIPPFGGQILTQLLLVARAIITDDTVGRCNSQFRATGGTDLPVAFAT